MLILNLLDSGWATFSHETASVRWRKQFFIGENPCDVLEDLFRPCFLVSRKQSKRRLRARSDPECQAVDQKYDLFCYRYVARTCRTMSLVFSRRVRSFYRLVNVCSSLPRVTGLNSSTLKSIKRGAKPVSRSCGVCRCCRHITREFLAQVKRSGCFWSFVVAFVCIFFILCFRFHNSFSVRSSSALKLGTFFRVDFS